MKLSALLLAFALVFVCMAGHAAVGAPAPTGQPLLQESEKAEIISEINTNLEQVPEIVRALLIGNNVTNIHILMETGTELQFCIVSEDGMLKDFEVGGATNPTLEIWAKDSTILEILQSENPVGEAQRAFAGGKITYKATEIIPAGIMAGISVLNWVVLFLIDILGFIVSLAGGR